MNKITVPAKVENLHNVMEYSQRAFFQLELSVEEVFVNIANYAYKNHDGKVVVCSKIDKNPLNIIIQFIDTGIPYNPLENQHPDISSTLKEKEIGGLGILLIKKNVDYLSYEHKDGKNILTIQKKLSD
jgi:serine/threonine-protein kinase RsbW